MLGLTASDMLREVKIVYEGIASADAPGYTNLQWSILLTQAQEKVIRDILDSGLERDSDSKIALANITKTPDPITSGISSYILLPNAYLVNFTDPSFNPLHIESEFIKIPSGQLIPVKEITWDEYGTSIGNPYSNPSIKSVFWKLMTDFGNVFITDGSVMSAYVITYVERPTPIIVSDISPKEVEGLSAPTDCILHHSIHRKIVDKAATLANAYVKDQLGYQISNIESTK